MKLIETNLTIQAFILTSCIASVMLTAKPAQAATFNVNGTDYDITTVTGSFNTLQTQLQSQLWWGNTQSASEFANLVGITLGTPNGYGPWFAFAGDASYTEAWGYWVGIPGSTAAAVEHYTGVNGGVNGDPEVIRTFAVASTPAAVPEPLTTLGAMTAVGFGAAFKRKLAKSQKDKKD